MQKPDQPPIPPLRSPTPPTEEDFHTSQAPTWMHRLTEFDGVDTLLLFFGLPASYAMGGLSGLLAGGLTLGTQMILRKTPVLLHTRRALKDITRLARGDRDIFNQTARNLLPFLNDAEGDIIQQEVLLPGQKAGLSARPPATPGRPITTTLQHLRHKPSTYRGLTPLPALTGYQIVIYGPTKSGKSSVIKALLLQRQEAEVLILDPHYEPGSWPSRVTVAGAGLNWAAIDQALDYTLAEMQRRYQLLATTPRGQLQFKSLYLIVDEMSALTGEIPDAGKRLFNLAQQGRKVDVWTILTPHSTEVEQMGAQGRGDARENFAYIEMPFVMEEDKYKPRVVTVYYGNPRRKDNLPAGRFVVPAPKTYTGSPVVNPTWLLKPRVQPVSKPQPQNVSSAGSERGSGRKSTLDTHKHGCETLRTYAEFVATCGRNGQEAEALVLHLLASGYGARKIGEFLPYATHEARQLVNTLRATHPEIPSGSRPDAGSSEEKALVQYLLRLGAPLRRIATLLDGNDGDNLTRIERY